MNRRDFITNSSLTAAGALLLPSAIDFKKHKEFGLQLYSVRKEVMTDSLNTLKEVAKMGYNYVEGFGYGNRKWVGLGDVLNAKKLLADSGLKMPSAHFILKTADYDFAKKDFSDNLKHTLRCTRGGSKIFREFIHHSFR